MLDDNSEVGGWFVYIIETGQSKLYTGITTDVERRFAEHTAAFEGSPKNVAKRGAKYFRANQPKAVVYRQAFANRSEASKREAEIKKMTKLQKLKLVEK